MQIAVMIQKSDRSHLVRHMVDIARDLMDRGNEVRLVSLLKGQEAGFAEELGEHHICLGASAVPQAVAILAKLMRSGEPDALLSAGVQANCVAGLARGMARSDFPMIFMEQDVPGYEETSGLLGRRFWSWMRRKTYPHASRIVVPSYEVKRRLLNSASLKDGRLSLLFNPGSGYFSPSIKAPHPWLMEARREAVFVSSGPLDRNSDFATLIEGVRRVQEDMPCKLVIVGEGPLQRRLANQVKSTGLQEKVAFASDIDRLHDYVYFSDGFVSTALSSASPDAAIRAMEVTSRVICTASPGGSREILGEGRYGKLLRMSDPDAVACALLEAVGEAKMRPSDRRMERFDRQAFFDGIWGIVGQAVSIEALDRAAGPASRNLAIEAA